MEEGGGPSAVELAARVARPEKVFSLPLPRATITVLAGCGTDMVVAGSRDALLLLIDLSGAQQPPRLRCSYALERPAMALAADVNEVGSGPSHLFVSTGSNAIERLVLSGVEITAPDDDLPAQLVGHGRGAVTALAASNGLLCSTGNDMTIRLWDGHACVALALLASGVAGPPCSLSISSDARLLLSASHAGAGAISVWQLPTLLAAASSGGSRDRCLAPVVSAFLGGLARVSGNLKGADEGVRHGGGGGDVSVGGSLECLHTFALGSNQVHAGCLAAGGAAAISASHTGELQCWDVERPREVQAWTFKHLGHTEPIRALALVGDALVTASSDRSLRVARCSVAAGAAGSKEDQRWATGPFAHPHGMDGSAEAATADAHGRAEGDGSVEDFLRGVEDAADALAADPDALLWPER